MANVDRPDGLRPVKTISGAPWANQVREYPVDASNGTAIFVGDLIKVEDDGNVAPSGAGGSVIGVCVGVEVVGVSDDNFIENGNLGAEQHPGYLPASTAGTVRVAVGSDILYEIQEDSVGSTLTAANIGSVGDVAAGAGSTTTGRSAYELDSSDVVAKDASPGAAQLMIVDYVRRPDNTVGSANARWLVKINEYQYAAGGTGL